MEWKPVESSQIAEVGFESPSKLGIRFKSKSGTSEYHYANIPYMLYVGMVEAISVGKFFAEHIKSKPDLYPFTKIDPGRSGTPLITGP